MAHPSRSEDLQDVEYGTYCVVISSPPEQLMKEGGGFERLFRKPHFTSRLIAVIVDETHCLKPWTLWEKLVLMNQYKISVAIGSFSVPAALTHFDA